MNKKKLVLVSLAVSLLGACGGGDPGGGNSGGGAVIAPPVQDAQVQIDAANAPAVTWAALNAAAFDGELGGIGGIGVVGSPAAQGMLSKLERLPIIGMSKVYSQTVNATVGPITEACLVSGTVTNWAVVSDPLSITAGDVLSSAFDMCDDGDGVVLNGEMGFRFTSFTGSLDTGLFSTEIEVHIEYGVTMDDGSAAGPVWVGGDYLISLNTLESPSVTTAVSSRFTLWFYREDGKSLAMNDFVTDIRIDVDTLSYEFMSTITADGTFGSSEFEGVANYATIEPFVAIGVSNPFTGQMLITGANNSSIRITALDDTTVRLDMDYDGDGAVDETVDLSWEAASSWDAATG